VLQVIEEEHSQAKAASVLEAPLTEEEQKAQKADARNAALEAELAALRAEKTRLEALQAQRRQTTGTGTGSGTGSGRE
jgi:hypothetical protein